MFCSYCKEFDKTSRNKFVSGCESMRIENALSHEASNSHKTSHSAFLNSKTPRLVDAHGPNQRPKQTETINWRQSVIAFYRFITKTHEDSWDMTNSKCLILCCSLALLNLKKSKAILCKLLDLAQDWKRCTCGEPFLEPSWSSWLQLKINVYVQQFT